MASQSAPVSISDEELRVALKAFGQEVGPVTETTRELYKKKLHSLINQQQRQHLTSTQQQPQPLQLQESTPLRTHEIHQAHDQGITTQASPPRAPRRAPIIVDEVEPNQISGAIVWVILSFFIGLFSWYTYKTLPEEIYLMQTLGHAFRKLFVLAIFPILLYGGYRFVKYFLDKRHQEEEKVYDFVEKIIGILQSPDNLPLMPVLHIRDTLMSPSERKTTKMTNLWDKTVRFIEEHESRVKVELVNIDGEDFRAWKWIGNAV